MRSFELLLVLSVAAPQIALPAIPQDAPAANRHAVAERGLPSDRSIVVPHALISPVQEARLPALRAGRLIAFDVQEGDEVGAGKSLARIDAQEAEAKAFAARESHEAALIEAASDLKIQAAGHATRFAELHRGLVAKVVAEMPHAVTAVEREQTVVRHEQAVLETALEREAMALATHRAAVRGAEERLAEIDVAERSLAAPFAGVVVERLAKEHEWVQQGEPVLHLVRMETLRAEAFLDMAEAAPADVAGKPVRVAVAVGAGRRDVFEGEVSFVSPILEADGAYRVRVEIANRRERGAWLLRPGMVGELTIAVGEPRASDTEPLASDESKNEMSGNVEEIESPVSTPTEIHDVETPEAARLELVLDDELVAAMTDGDPNGIEDASDEAIAGAGEASHDAGR